MMPLTTSTQAELRLGTFFSLSNLGKAYMSIDSSNPPLLAFVLRTHKELFRTKLDRQPVLNITYFKSPTLSEILCVCGPPKMNLKLGTLAKKCFETSLQCTVFRYCILEMK